MGRMTQTFPEYVEGKRKTIRVLEVGAGTGSAAKAALRYMNGTADSWEYTYTDISASFFSSGERIFEGSGIKVHYRILNIEEDPFEQAFIPQHYDLIIANNGIHATKKIRATMSKLRLLLQDNGIISIAESIRPARPTNLVFGALEGYWVFTDTDLRPYNCEISMERRKSVLMDTGFGHCITVPSFGNTVGNIVGRAKPDSLLLRSMAPSGNGSTWIVFCLENYISAFFKDNLRMMGNQVISVKKSNAEFRQTDSNNFTIRPEHDSDVSSLFAILRSESKIVIKGVIFLWGLEDDASNYDSVCRPYLNICKLIVTADSAGIELYTFTRGVFSVEDHPVSDTTLTPIVVMTKCVQNENPDTNCRVVDFAGTDEPLSPDMLKEAFSELVVDDREIYVAYRGNQRHILRSKSWNKGNNPSVYHPQKDSK
jgi:SAM-dependent methyltransferase